MADGNKFGREPRKWHKYGMNAIRAAIIYKDELKSIAAVDDRLLGALTVLEVELYNTRLAIRQAWCLYNNALEDINALSKQALVDNRTIERWEARYACLWNQVRDEKFKELQRKKHEQQAKKLVR